MAKPKRESPDIDSLCPAIAGWRAVFEADGVIEEVPIACWALVRIEQMLTDDEDIGPEPWIRHEVVGVMAIGQFMGCGDGDALVPGTAFFNREDSGFWGYLGPGETYEKLGPSPTIARSQDATPEVDSADPDTGTSSPAPPH